MKNNLFEAVKLELKSITTSRELKFTLGVILLGVVAGLIIRFLQIEDRGLVVTIAIVVDVILAYLMLFALHYSDATKYSKETGCSFEEAWEKTNSDCGVEYDN